MVKKYYSLRRKTYSFPANTENSIATFLMAMLFLLSLCTTIIFPLAPLSLARVSPYKSFFYLHSSTNSNIRLFINELQQIFAYTLLPLVPQKATQWMETTSVEALHKSPLPFHSYSSIYQSLIPYHGGNGGKKQYL